MIAPLRGVRRYLWSLRRLWRARPRHWQPWGALLSAPPPLSDRSTDEMQSINACSQAYFEHAENREFWFNRPYSDPPTAPRCLYRMGLLLEILHLRAGIRVLDFACGTGWTSVMLARMGAHVTAMDIAPAAIAIAREGAERALPPQVFARMSFEVFDGTRIQAPDESFDAILVYDAFHHLPNPNAVLREFHRVLAPHGRFAFAEPGLGHAASESSAREREHGVLEEDIDLERLYRSLLAAGFSDLDIIVPPPDPAASILTMTHARDFLRGIPWSVPADETRHAILTGPLGIARKGPYRFTTLAPQQHQARIHATTDLMRCARGEGLTLAAKVENRCSTVWLREGRHGVGYVRLGAHLIGADGRTLSFDYGRAVLPHDLARYQSALLQLALQAPSEPGRYTVVLDMVNEGFCWFAETGSPTTAITLIVT